MSLYLLTICGIQTTQQSLLLSALSLRIMGAAVSTLTSILLGKFACRCCNPSTDSLLKLTNPDFQVYSWVIMFCLPLQNIADSSSRTWRGERGEQWSSAQGLESILISIQSLMSSNPYENEPGYENAKSGSDKKNMKTYVAKVRADDLIGSRSRTDNYLPRFDTKLCE